MADASQENSVAILKNASDQRDATASVVEVPPPKERRVWWRWVVGLFWDSVEGDPRNRRYLYKLDGFLLFVKFPNLRRCFPANE